MYILRLYRRNFQSRLPLEIKLYQHFFSETMREPNNTRFCTGNIYSPDCFFLPGQIQKRLDVAICFFFNSGVTTERSPTRKKIFLNEDQKSPQFSGAVRNSVFMSELGNFFLISFLNCDQL